MGKLTTWFWLVDGVPACESPHTLGVDIDPPTVCAWATKEEAEAEAARFLLLRPGHSVEVHPSSEHPRDPDPRDEEQ